MTPQEMDSTTCLVIDAATKAADATWAQTAKSSLKEYMPLLTVLGAILGSAIAATAQARIARFNADRSEASRLTARKQEVISEGVLELIKLDPHSKVNSSQNQSALRHANSIKLFLDEGSPTDQRLEKIIDELVFCFTCVVNPNLDEELIERIELLEDPYDSAKDLTEERREKLLERLTDAYTQVLPAARSSIAATKARS